MVSQWGHGQQVQSISDIACNGWYVAVLAFEKSLDASRLRHSFSTRASFPEIKGTGLRLRSTHQDIS
jgi:hypothetical protein